ncbi:conserved phage C-terminal domain-containing protein [Oceanobacillus oncorhynchi]|uniref:conserved phage C-terminal domain-containing protein n=1 Tax=Oceanobacillus oncorhynchi TaxID=545501 RepID=UPI0025A44494|nr:conserved phage C-terminal domain-containing protein [Oceanobacillus oncorhynchi]MDM8098690.1 conserved phage C-terminal domain-containing protein [Oceanobacillus oncorhynchi]
MSIFRVKKNANYVVMNRTALNDNRLTWKAKGIIAYMLSMPDDWTFYVTELINHAKDGEKSFRSGLKELKDCGYVKRFPVYEDKKIARWETVIYETPQKDGLLTQNLQVGNVEVGKVDVEKEALLSTELVTSTDSKPSIEEKIPFSEIVSYLNEKINSKYKPSSSKTKSLIKKRWNEGFRLDDFKKVIDVKANEWINNDKMRRYLRPETLFGNKFEGYLNQQAEQQPPDPYDQLF